MSTVNTSTKQGTAGSRLSQAKMLLQKDTYTNGIKNSVLNFISILSIVALYWVILAVWLRNAFQSLKGRRATNIVVTRKNPPRDSEPIAKPVEDIGLNMDDVQEIPGEGELAAKEAMPAGDQIPEIDDETQVENTEERHIMSDDDTTVVGQDDLVSVKGSPVVVPVNKDNFERPITPPITPLAQASDEQAPAVDIVEDLQANLSSDAPSVVNVVPDESFALRSPPARNSTIEEATKAVEDHARFVEDAISPTDSTADSTKHEIGSPVSEFVVVPDAEVEDKLIENVPVPTEDFNKAAEETESKPPVVAESATEVPVPEIPPPTAPAAESEQTPVIVVEEPKIDVAVPVIEEPKPVEQVKQVEEPKVVEEPQVVEEPKEPEAPVVVEEPVVEEPEAAEEPKAEEPKEFPSVSKREDSVSSSPPKSLARPRVVRRATGSTAAIAGITTSPTPATVAVAPVIDDKVSARAQTARRADEALNRLAGSILRSNTSDRLPSRPTSPVPSFIPRATSPPPRPSTPKVVPRSASPANFARSESPASDAGAGSRLTSPISPISPISSAFGIARRGSISAPRPISRQSTLANVPERSSPPSRKTTFANTPRGGSVSPPPMPLPPQRQGSQRAVSPQRQGSVRGLNPQVPQAAVTSPSVLPRNATVDSNGSPGSPPNGRRAASPPPSSSRAPAEELTIDQVTRRDVPFPSEGQSIASGAAVKQRSRPRTSTSGSAATAPNTLLSTLTSKITFPGNTKSNSIAGSGPTSPSLASPTSPTSPVSPASPNRSDSFASAVSNRSSIYSFSDMSDMDMSASDLDFAGREGHRMALNGARYDSMSSIASSDGGMSGNEEEKREKRAKRRAKARAQALKKQKRSKRN